MNPWYDALIAIAASLADPAIVNLPTPDVRELPFVLGSDAPPLCFVCPDRTGRRIHRQTFGSTQARVFGAQKMASGGRLMGAAKQPSVHWDFPCVVLLIAANNRQVKAALEARLQLDWDVTQRLNVPALGSMTVEDVDVDPRAVNDVAAALGTNYVVSGLGLLVRAYAARGD